MSTQLKENNVIPIPQSVKSLEPPFKLNRRAKRHWKELLPELIRLELVTMLDTDAFAQYCMLHDQWLTAQEKLEKEEEEFLELETASGTKKAVQSLPIKKEIEALQRQINILRTDLGLSPKSRAALKKAGLSKPLKPIPTNRDSETKADILTADFDFQDD